MGYWPLAVGEITVTCVCAPYHWQIALSEWFFLLHSAAAVCVAGITASAPFNGVNDENLAIAYISMFILVFFVRPLYSQSTIWS